MRILLTNDDGVGSAGIWQAAVIRQQAAALRLPPMQ